MSNRIKQFITAISASITDADRSYVERFLSPDLQKLFWCMNVPEQRHALNVAYTAAKLAEGKQCINYSSLIKAALLHDVGKVKGDISIPDKVMTVLADKLCPYAARRLSKEGRGSKISNVRHAMFVYYRHAERGADMLAASGAEAELVDWVRRHHKAPTMEDPTELTLLKTADALN